MTSITVRTRCQVSCAVVRRRRKGVEGSAGCWPVWSAAAESRDSLASASPPVPLETASRGYGRLLQDADMDGLTPDHQGVGVAEPIRHPGSPGGLPRTLSGREGSRLAGARQTDECLPFPGREEGKCIPEAEIFVRYNTRVSTSACARTRFEPDLLSFEW